MVINGKKFEEVNITKDVGSIRTIYKKRNVIYIFSVNGEMKTDRIPQNVNEFAKIRH